MRPTTKTIVLSLFAALLGGLLVGCRGDLSSEPPVHVNPNMDKQAYYRAQEPNPFFADGRGMRPQVAGTIAVGELAASDHLYRGKRLGKWAEWLAVPLKQSVLERGQRRYNIYCSTCHGYTGEGTASMLVKKKMAVRPPSYLDPRLLAMPAGQIFDVISHGARTMPPYGSRIPVRDRWAIVAYVRALQIAGTAPIERVPGEIAKQKGWSK